MSKRLKESQKVYGKLLVLTCLTVSIASCKEQSLSKLPLESLPEGEVYISHTYNSKWGYVVGSRNVYWCIGKGPLGEQPGLGISPTRYFRFRLKYLLDKWPQIKDKRLLRSIEMQEKRLDKEKAYRGVENNSLCC